MNVTFSCVVDGRPRFEWQAFLWARSLIDNAGVDPGSIRLHCTPGVTAHFRETMQTLGAVLVEIEPFEGGHAYCNKIQQCFSGAFAGFDRVVLCDCDLFFLRCPDLQLASPFAANLVNLPNPPLPILEEIYRRANVPHGQPVPVEAPLTHTDLTFPANVNGGFYSIDASRLATIGERWKHHALWMIENIGLLGPHYPQHVDQVAMALALDELGIPVTPLGAGANFHTHLPAQRLAAVNAQRIDVLHYHSGMLPDGHIKTTGLPAIDAAIAQANAGIDAIVVSHFDNALFWDWRYAEFPELGSGIGSRGDILELKRTLLTHLTAAYRDKRVLDVGCGDIETTRALDLRHYTGIDLSDTALTLAAAKRPDWTFREGSIDASDAGSADLVICLDVLIHQKSRADYDRLLGALVAAARDRLIVSGFDAVPSLASSITGFHEPLHVSLERFGVFSEIIPVGAYRDLTLFVANKAPAGLLRHLNDVPNEVLTPMLPLVKRKELLVAAMDVSRANLGFFTRTSIRMVEYPWMYEKLLSLAPGSAVLDIGAGASPLPILLAHLGARVDCVDSHPRMLDLSQRAQWNEWGYLDYSALHPAIRSFHADIMRYQPDQLYDVVYSLSVIEHMPRPIWEGTLDRAAAWLRPGGRLLLTLDLVPGTVNLWNRSEGAVVDAEGTHGTIDDIAKRVASRGLTIDEGFVIRNIPHSRTDVVFLVAHSPVPAAV